MYLIERELKDFSAAHRLLAPYEGKCRHLHGHNYAVRVTIGSETLDDRDFVIDFAEVKTYFDAWMQEYWDHGVLVSDADQALLDFVHAQKQKHYILTDGRNTTAERLAEELYAQFSSVLAQHNERNGAELHLLSVRVAEHSRSSAIVTTRS